MMVCVWGNVIVNNFTIPYSMYGSTEKYVEIEGGRQSNENHQKQRVMEHLKFCYFFYFNWMSTFGK